MWEKFIDFLPIKNYFLCDIVTLTIRAVLMALFLLNLTVMNHY